MMVQLSCSYNVFAASATRVSSSKLTKVVLAISATLLSVWDDLFADIAILSLLDYCKAGDIKLSNRNVRKRFRCLQVAMIAIQGLLLPDSTEGVLVFSHLILLHYRSS